MMTIECKCEEWTWDVRNKDYLSIKDDVTLCSLMSSPNPITQIYAHTMNFRTHMLSRIILKLWLGASARPRTIWWNASHTWVWRTPLCSSTSSGWMWVWQTPKVGDIWFPLRPCGVTCHSHGTKIFVKVVKIFDYAVEDGQKFLK